ncbi:hypothetical protein LXL04_002308 [Taraxacum kok-saghyz]
MIQLRLGVQRFVPSVKSLYLDVGISGFALRMVYKLTFYIQATIQDETQSIPISLVDDVVKKLCGCTCEQLILRIGNDDRKNIPHIFQKNVKCFYTFHVQLRPTSVTMPESGSSTSCSSPSSVSTMITQAPVTILESESSPTPTFSSPVSTPATEPPGSSSSMTVEPKVITESEKQDTTRSGKAKRVLFADADPDPLLDINPSKREQSISFENSYILENPRTPKPLTFSKNRHRGAKNRSNTSPIKISISAPDSVIHSISVCNMMLYICFNASTLHFH